MDANTFSLAQMTSNGDGKTSATGVMGSLCITVGLLTFIFGTVLYAKSCSGSELIISQSMMLITAGAGLLGVRKIGGSFGKAGTMAVGGDIQVQSQDVNIDKKTETDVSERESFDRV